LLHLTLNNPQMKNNYTVHIPTPCHENWDAMAPVEQGRFCQSCAKQVVDFSMMTDQEVLNYFSKATGSTCGRFNNDQLQRPLQPTKIEKKKAWWVAAMMPLLMLVEKAGAQKKNSQCAKPNIISQRTAGEAVFMGKVLAPGIKPVRTVTGYIIDTLGKPVPYATIKFNNRYKTNADSVGAFTLAGVLNDAANDIEVSCIGYKTQNVALIDTTDSYEIVLQETINDLKLVVVDSWLRVDRCSYTTGASVVGLDINVESFKQPKDNFLLKPFIKAPFNVYPNPAPRGANVTIAFKNEGEYSIQLFDNSGKLVNVDKYNAVKAFLQTTLTIPSSLTAGMYFIRLVNEKNKKQYTSKLIVM